jgi:hypothetical protein
VIRSRIERDQPVQATPPDLNVDVLSAASAFASTDLVSALTQQLHRVADEAAATQSGSFSKSSFGVS